jgi:hypothetical protein
MTINEIWNALDNNQEVNWGNKSYYIHAIEAKEANQYATDTYRDGYALRCTCKSNYFGSLLHKSEFSQCFIEKK